MHHRRPATHRGRTLRWVLAAVCVAAVAAGAVLIVAGTTPHPPPPAPSAQHPFAVSPEQAQTQAGSPSDPVDPAAGLPAVLAPDRLYIPSLRVDAPLRPETIAADGDFVVPTDVHDVGMSSVGAQLTAPDGTVLVAGHVNDVDQGDGALYQLSTITPGAVVVVTGGDAVPTRWAVTSLANVTKSVLPQDIFDPHGVRRLVLVTCGGKILTLPGGTHTYSDNIVVSATPVATTTVGAGPR